MLTASGLGCTTWREAGITVLGEQRSDELHIHPDAPTEDPWASKTSVLAALQEAGPMRAKRPNAEHDADDPMRGMNLGSNDEDPLLSMGAERKAKKAKKEKKEKKEKDKDKKKKQVLAYLYRSVHNLLLQVAFMCPKPWLAAMSSLYGCVRVPSLYHDPVV